jgi:predicted dehydrogenase
LVEKPIATTLEDADKIIRSAEKHSVKMTVGHILRFDPRYCLAKQAVERGDIGDIVSISARRVDMFSEQIYRKGRVSLMLYLGVHDLDALRWFTGSEPRSVYAQAVRKLYKEHALDVEDMIYSIYGFKNESVGMVEIGSILPDNYPQLLDAKMKIFGSKGVIDIDYEDAGITINDGKRTLQPDIIYSPEYLAGTKGSLRLEIEHFLDCVRNEGEPVVTVKDARAALRMALCAIESSKTNKIVSIS